MFGVGVGIRVGGTGFGGGSVVLVPTATAATSVGATSFTANWNAFSGANYYLLDVSLSSSFSTFVLQDTVVLTTSYNVTGLTSNTTYYYRVRAVTGSDSDAMAFVSRVYTAGGALSYNEVNATNQLVLDLKSYSIWTKMKAIYPMVGASAAACAQNLVSSSFTGTFNGGWTYASTGVTPNGTSGYMNTGLNYNTEIGLNSTHYTYYSRTNNTSSGFDIGCYSGGQENWMALGYHNTSYYYPNPSGLAISTTDTRGFYIGTFTINSINLFKNSTKIQTKTSSTYNSTNLNVYIGAANAVGLDYSNHECALASIGNGLTDTEASNFYTAVQTFNTTLLRQV